MPKAKLEALRLQPGNTGLSDKQILANLSGWVMTVLYPHPGASFGTGGMVYPEGEIPIEIEGRPPDGTLSDQELTFWNA